jgi:hypothetical protein
MGLSGGMDVTFIFSHSFDISDFGTNRSPDLKIRDTLFQLV